MNQDSDLQIAGDLLEVQHLLRPAPEHPSTVAGFVRLARTVAADRARWAPLVAYDPTSRWYHRLETGPGYEVWLLSWLPGQGSGAHDHGRSAGVMTVLDGALTEHTPGGRQVLRPGGHRVVAPGHAHEVVNDALEPAVSLHVYFPGLTTMPVRTLERSATTPAEEPARLTH
ncbi:cysteine dioxygenase [Streptomyces albidoflavus]|jgi:quercetin dioxygenase-like cupin family protein|uniref:Cysteine dioxygenase n=3 Tax=Streptomyces TaxID=1883 RepID=A0A126Y112_9ACTN|nr:MULTISPECIES: cysteine dioxygenase family protein [Streptomyces]MYQ74973.1 cysteine dioxygenase [Streptomyces sp. SID4934]MYX49876.1 cysteine dioxygenase [Streptomyces sp. SID8385]MYX87947.1 cysteine dioxygenase [Streptomyces sp. SID4915]NUW08641.1 cysteine dioxygenase [Streptomyces sp. CAI-21]NVI31205.1 cysteine dioxygenase [Streptomyces sp. CAI-17]QLA56918.1 cysteine dioxygenase family protein [Streptomyces violascens]BDH50950.1 cysteine dioxygenase [Streptomyces albus]